MCSGMKPAKRRTHGRTLEKHEMKELFAKGSTERDPGDIERVEGLGFAP